MPPALPRVIADGPLAQAVLDLLRERVELLPWSAAEAGSRDDVQAVYTYGHPRVDGPMLDRLPGVRIVSNYGVGVDHIDVPAAAARGVLVGNTPGVLEATTADQGFALLLALARRVVEGARYAHGPDFLRYDPGYMLGTEVHHAVLGIVGLGQIGKQVAQRARGFDMRVLYYGRNRQPQAEAALGVTYRPLEELFSESDFVMLCTPLTSETRHLIDRAALKRMKPTAQLINIARGGVVDHAALVEALSAGELAGAALDVTDPEPLPRDHPLLKLDNVLIVPHLGSATRQTRQRMAELSVENLIRGLRGEPLLHEVRPAT